MLEVISVLNWSFVIERMFKLHTRLDGVKIVTSCKVNKTRNYT